MWPALPAVPPVLWPLFETQRSFQSLLVMSSASESVRVRPLERRQVVSPTAGPLRVREQHAIWVRKGRPFAWQPPPSPPPPLPSPPLLL